MFTDPWFLSGQAARTLARGYKIEPVGLTLFPGAKGRVFSSIISKSYNGQYPE